MKFSWHWFRLSRAAWRSVTLVVVLLVLYVVAGRQLMPQLDRTAPSIARYLSEQLDQPVAFESLQGYWYGLRPTLVFEGVGIAEELSVERVVLEPAILASLIHQSPRFSRLELNGIRIELEQSEGVWKIPSLSALGHRPWYETLALLSGEGFGVDAINLRDITVSLKDQEQVLDVHILDGVWLSDRRHQQLRGVANIHGLDQVVEANLQLDILSQGDQQDIFLSLNHDLFNYLSMPPALRSNLPWQPETLVLAAHSRWHWQQGQLQALQVDVNEGYLNWQTDAGEHFEFSDVRFKLAWQHSDDYRLQVRHLSFTREGLVWPSSDFDVRWHDEALTITAEHVALEPLHHIAQAFSPIGFLDELEPRGVVRELSLVLPRAQQQFLWSDLTASGTLQSVQVNRYRWVPGLSDLNGQFAMSGQQGFVQLSPSNVAVDLPDFLPEPIDMRLSGGLIGWHLSASGRLQVTSSELNFGWRDSGQVLGRFNFSAALGDDPDVVVEPVFSLSLSGNQLHKESLMSALPRMVPAGVQQWLAQQLDTLSVDGWSVSLPNVLSPDVKTRLGLMAADIESAQIDIGDQWPSYSVERAQFIMDYSGLNVSITDSDYGDMAIARAEMHLPFTERPVLRMHGVAMGRTEDALHLVRNTPIRERLHPQLLSTEMVGSLAGTVALSIPLHGDPISLDLGLSLRNVDVFWPNFDVLIEEVSGPVSISLQEGIHSSGLMGRFLDGPIETAITSTPLDQGGWRIELPTRGAVHSASISDWLGLSLGPNGAGQSLAYEGRLLFSPQVTTIEVVTDVAELAQQWRLPIEPLTTELSLQLDFEDQARAMMLSWPGLIVADVRTFVDGYPMNGHVALGQASPQMRADQGVLVDLKVDAFNALHWQDFWQTISDNVELGDHEVQAWRSFLTSLNRWNITEFHAQANTVQGWSFFEDQGFDVRLRREPAAWQGDFSMARANGLVWIPDALDRPGRLSLDEVILGDPDVAEDLDIEPVPAADRIYPDYDPELDPLSGIHASWFPNLSLSAREVILNGQSLGPWSMNMQADSEQLTFIDILGQWRTVDVTGEVTWLTPKNESHRTQADLTLRAGNVGDVLTASKLSPVVISRRASAQLKLNWPGSVVASNRYRWQGDIRFDLQDGSVLDLDDMDAVRLIGLLNVTRIFRRLSLDFQDVFGAGVAFDRVRGHLIFDDGLVTVGDRLTLQGSGARMFFEGDYQMLRDQLDAEGVMVARVSNAAGLLAIGAGFAPPIALAIILGERALEREIERLFSVRTTITGSLAQPNVSSRRLFDSDIRGADSTFQERLRELFGPDQRTDESAP